jgi:ABC-type phosphonate transport system ATPase subunit
VFSDILSGESEVFDIDPGPCAERYTAFNDMREFPRVAWPVVLFQRTQGLRRQVAGFEMIGGRMALEKGLRQQGNIVAMLA